MSSHKATESFCFDHTMQQIYEENNKSTLERLGRQGTFKFRALWSVRDGKGLNKPSILVPSMHHTAASNKTETQYQLIIVFFTNLLHKFFILIHLLHSSTCFKH